MRSIRFPFHDDSLSSDDTSVPLLRLPSITDPEGTNGSGSLHLKESRSHSSLPTWILYGCVVCTILNVILCAYVSATGEREFMDKGSKLPRPNQYIGLEKVNRTDSGLMRPDPLHNFPPLLTQISRRRKNYVFPDDSRRFFTLFGTVSPDDRHFLVNDTVNTIAQFRTIDFGMEDCQIVINIPSQEVLNSTEGGKSFSLSKDSVSIEVWRLDAKTAEFIDRSKLSWRTRPPRSGRQPFAVLKVSEGAWVATEHFQCASDSLQTWEFVCASDSDCAVDFWQDTVDPLLAVFLLQHPSV